MSEANQDSPKFTIAVVEDNPDNMLLLRVLLENHFQLQEYFDGVAAAKGIVSNPPDLVLMDISLPVMDGVKVLHRIRKVKKLAGLPVIALTAHAMVGDRERFLAAGFDYYLSKPILGLEYILDPIESLLNKS